MFGLGHSRVKSSVGGCVSCVCEVANKHLSGMTGILTIQCWYGCAILNGLANCCRFVSGCVGVRGAVAGFAKLAKEAR